MGEESSERRSVNRENKVLENETGVAYQEKRGSHGDAVL